MNSLKLYAVVRATLLLTVALVSHHNHTNGGTKGDKGDKGDKGVT